MQEALTLEKWDRHLDRATYINGNNTWRVPNINGSIWKEVNFILLTCFELEKHLFLPNFSEIKFTPIKWLQNLIDSKFSWPLLEVTTLIQLSYKTIISWNDLSGNIK